MIDWWRTKVRQAFGYAHARVTEAERASLAGWLTPAQLELFDRMHVADRRHGLNVVAALRRTGVTDEELLVAALLHDAGKGRATKLAHRVVWSLGEAYGDWVWRVFEPMPTFRGGLTRMREHAERSATLAERAGCSPRVAELIRNQASPRDEAGRLLAEADEANP